MNPLPTSVFDLPHHLARKADPVLIASDEHHFTQVARSLDESISNLRDRIDAERKAPGGGGRAAMDRDMEVHRLTARLRTLRRFGVDLCLGHMVGADGSDPVYVGRLGLTDSSGRQLMVDWRSPVAEPFFGATHADPMGLTRRRRYRWSGEKITDYWDEVFTMEGELVADSERSAALDDQSAFIASLGQNRSAKMRDVLGTIAADQDAIIRGGSRGALVVDGGPGTGKTVVALHRTAYLLYSDPRLGHQRGGVLFVGPHEPYLAYVADVLPSLGEEGVRTCTVRDLVPEGAKAKVEADPAVARLKASADLVKAVEVAVRFYEKPPTKGMTVETDWTEIWLSAEDWAAAFRSPDRGTPHNEAREAILEELIEILIDRYRGDVGTDQVRKSLRQNDDLRAALNRAWPMVDATDLVGDLWSVPAYLRMCAPWLDSEDVAALQRSDPRAWTVSDLPLLDAARHRLGDPEAASRIRRRRAALRRCPSRSFTIVGDRAQARHGFTVTDPGSSEVRMESWRERLERVGLDHIDVATLGINYRTPEEVMTEAEPVIRAVVPDANVPMSVRRSGFPVDHRSVADLGRVINLWLTENPDGTVCVIDDDEVDTSRFGEPARVRWLTPQLSKGLEFDLVILIDPESFGVGVEGAVDRYVAMTRATQRLVVLTG